MTESFYVTLERNGERSAWRGSRNVAREGQGDSEHLIRWLLSLSDAGIRGGRVAHIGGGFCVLARILGPQFSHFIFEIDPEMAKFAPAWSQVIVGDWQDTLRGSFDVIVYDIGGTVPVDRLSSFLKDGGRILS